MKLSFFKPLQLLFVIVISLPSLADAQFGPPEGRGGDRGGDRGGGGGDRGGRGGGGDRGGRSSRGGFDPSSFLSRLDRNGNGIIDPDEQQGPAQFLIQRMQSADPSIKPGQPISIKRVTEAFQKAREQRDGGGDSSRGSSSDDDGLTAELLVPGFGAEVEPPMLSGFGASAELMDVVVTEEDRQKVRETVRRFDRNRDGVLSEEEVRRFSGNPMDFDRNKDGRLTESELALRFARRREFAEESRSEGRDRGRDRGDSTDAEPPNVYGDRKSYRIDGGKSLPEGLPGFFTEKDADNDGQIAMYEFTTEWDETSIKEFFKSDLNGDGFITAREAIRAIEEEASAPAESGETVASTGSSATSSSSGGSVGTASEKYMGYAQRILKRSDKDGNGVLTGAEWKEMLLDVSPADFDKDGKITVKEYAWWIEQKSKR